MTTSEFDQLEKHKLSKTKALACTHTRLALPMLLCSTFSRSVIQSTCVKEAASHNRIMELKIKVWFQRAKEDMGVISVSTFFALQEYIDKAYSLTLLCICSF